MRRSEGEGLEDDGHGDVGLGGDDHGDVMSWGWGTGKQRKKMRGKRR
jgi:hypothetical protein